MTPIVVCVIGFNIVLALAGFWLVWTIVQWRQTLIQLNQSLLVAQIHLHEGFPFPQRNQALEALQTQYQQLHRTVQPQIFPLLRLLISVYQIQRRWNLMQKNVRRYSAPSSTLNSAPNSSPSSARRGTIHPRRR